MHIFIDESGGFIPLNGQRTRISAVAALVFPSRSLKAVVKQYRAIRRRYVEPGTELKGARLPEAGMAEIAKLLTEYDVIGEAVMIDNGALSQERVRTFQEGQADRIVDAPADDADSMAAVVESLQRKTRGLSAQNFVQGYLTIHLVEKVLWTALTYHAQRDARELSCFHWVIDQKDVRRTPVEELWTELIVPLLHVRSKKNPVAFIPWGDYSHFAAFDIPDTTNPDRGRIDMYKVLEQRSFEDSRTSEGLQLADVFASGLTRAYNNRLGPDGWEPFGKLLVHRNANEHLPKPIQFVTFRIAETEPLHIIGTGHLAEVHHRLLQNAKPAVPSWHLKQMPSDEV